MDLIEEDTTHVLIQIDASNAFNSINRTLLLHNVKSLCPEVATHTHICYIKAYRLFITGGEEISSNEETTQGDPIAMGMYALRSMPLPTLIISNTTEKLIQVTFADDLTGVGKIQEIIEWWKNVLYYGLYLGYDVHESKSWLIMKEEYIKIANEIFKTIT